jgi:hypothetical protein
VTPPDENDVRYVEVMGLPVGKFRQHPDTRRWQFQWLTWDGFEGAWNELRPTHEEHVEHWAVTEIARNIYWDESDRQDASE